MVLPRMRASSRCADRVVSSGPSRSKKAARRAPPEYVDPEPMGEDDSDGMGDDYDDYDDDDDDVGQKRKAPAKRATGSSRSWLLPSCPLTDAYGIFFDPQFRSGKSSSTCGDKWRSIILPFGAHLARANHTIHWAGARIHFYVP